MLPSERTLPFLSTANLSAPPTSNRNSRDPAFAALQLITAQIILLMVVPLFHVCVIFKAFCPLATVPVAVGGVSASPILSSCAHCSLPTTFNHRCVAAL